MQWTHPICAACYATRYPGREPVALINGGASEEKCCDCGTTTSEGVYFRADPRTLKFPAGENAR